MIRLACALLIAPSSVLAGFDCTLNDMACTSDCAQTHVTFEIDPAQFVAPQDPNDPPRRQVTSVTMNDAEFVAEAIMMPGGVFGFFEDAGELGSRLMIVQSDGSARLGLQPINQTWVGTCQTVP